MKYIRPSSTYSKGPNVIFLVCVYWNSELLLGIKVRKIVCYIVSLSSPR